MVEIAATAALADPSALGACFSTVVSGAQASANEPAVHGIAPAEIAQSPNFSEAWARFVAFAKGLIDLSLPDDSGDTYDSEDDDSQGPPRMLSEPPELLVVAHNGVRCWDVC